MKKLFSVLLAIVACFYFLSCKKDKTDCDGNMTVQTNFSWALHDSWWVKIYKQNNLVHEKHLTVYDGKQDTIQLPAATYQYVLVGYISSLDDAYMIFDSTSKPCEKVVLSYN